MKKVLIIFLALSFFTAGSAFSAEKVLLFRFKSTGVDEQLLDAADQIFGDALGSEGVFTPVRAHEVIGNVQCHSPECAGGYAEDAGYEKALIGSMTRLGSKVVVSVRMISAGENNVIRRAESSSESVEDLDIVLKRLAKSISTGRSVAESAEVGMISEKETDPERRRTSITSKGLRAGFLWTLDDSYGRAERLTGVDFVVQHDMTDYFLSGKTGYKWGGGAWGFTWLQTKIGRYLSRGDFSPFISLGLAIETVSAEYRTTRDGRSITEDDRKTGLGVSAGTGFTLFRTYNFQFQLDLDYYILIEEMGPAEQGSKFPQGFMMTFCLKNQ